MKPRTLVSVVVSVLVLVALLVAGLAGISPAIAATTSFSDVPDDHPNAAAIADLSSRGIINGFDDGTFKPNNSVTRQQFAKMIVKTLGIAVPPNIVCPFTDVDPTPNPTDPYYPAKYVAVCAQEGITAGKTATLFAPTESITRQQLITMIVRAAELPDPPAEYVPPFSATQFSLEEHYLNARRAAYAGLLGTQSLAGYDFSAAANRAECAQFLHNLLVWLDEEPEPETGVPLLDFTWKWGANWQSFEVDNVSDLVGNGISGSSNILGDPYYSFDDPSSTDDYIFATGEDGDLLVFWIPSGSANWTVEHLASPTGARLSPLLGGRAFNEVMAVTVKSTKETLHVFATDADENLIHFWLTQGADWQSEDVSAKTGQKMALVGSACSWEDYETVQVVGTSSDGDLLHFWQKGGGSWHSENVSQEVSRKIRGEASFNWDVNAGLGTAVIAAGPDDEFLIFHHDDSGSWSVEDVTAATATESSSGVTLGGWLSWWWWEGLGPNGAQFKNPVAVLDTNGHFWVLERASSAAPWTATDVSALIGQTFRADTGGDSIIPFDNPPSIPSKEIHFAGVNQDQDFIRVWRDTAGSWHGENITAITGQKVAHPVNQYLATAGGTGGWYDYVAAIAPNGDLVFIWDNVLERDWKVFNASTATGYKVRPPELPWRDSSGENHLVFGGLE